MGMILFIAIAAISFLVQQTLQSKFKKYSQVALTGNMTGADIDRKMLNDPDPGWPQE